MHQNSTAAVLCVATDGFDTLWSFCIDSQRRYADRIGGEFFLETANPWADLTPHWSKFRRALELLDSGRDLAIVDADIFMREHTPPFQEVLRAHPHFDIFFAMGRSGRPNSGFLILRGGSEGRARQLIHTCLENRSITLPQQDFVTTHGENGHFIHFSRMEPFRSATFELPQVWNRTDYPILDADYNIHFTGPLASGHNILDGCIAISDVIPGSSRIVEGLRHGYFNHRSTIQKIVRKLPGGTSIARALGSGLKKATGLKTSPRGRGLQNAFWKIEAPLRTLEYPTTIIVRQLLRPGDTVVDAGGHIGYLSQIFAEAVGPSGEVLAIEAHPENAKLLRQNTGRLGVKVAEVALSQAPGEVTFFEGSGHSNHSLFEGASTATGQITVKAERLEAVLRAHGISEVTLMKMDIEGAEVDALRSGESFLASGAFKAILIEINPKVLKAAGKRIVDLSALLAEHGYTLRQIRDDYHFGPTGFVSRQETANYIAARSEGWRFLADRMGVPDIAGEETR